MVKSGQMTFIKTHTSLGSTFKSYGLAAAIQEGAFDPDKKYKSGHRDIMGSRISDWNRVGWG